MDGQSIFFSVLMIFFKTFCPFAFAVAILSSEHEKVILGKPNYSCGESGNIEEIKTQTTLIRLSPNTDVLYSVNTDRVSTCTANKSCTRMTWKIIRDFEIYLNTFYYNTGLSGVIEFPNNLVTSIIPGFNYLLHVSLKQLNGTLQKKTYNLTFENDEDLKDLVLGELELVVANNHIVYRNMPLVINAEVRLCGNISFHYFIWFVVTKEKRTQLPEKSSTLFLEVNYTVTNFPDKFVIYCQVINNENENIIVDNFVEVDMVQPPMNQNSFAVYLPFTYTTIKTGSNVLITPYIYGTIDASYKSEWICLANACRRQTQKQFYLESGFHEEGNYTIVFTITAGDVIKSATGLIMVLSDSPSIEFELSHSYTVEVIVTISDLRTYCKVQWLHNDEIDLLTLPDLSVTYNVSSKDKTFLEELVEFGELTVTKKFTVKLPTPSNTWKGLESGYYHLDLSVSCPFIGEITDEEVYREVPENFSTYFSQCQFFVPPEPTLSVLEVFSEGNMAFLTEYTFSIESTNQSHLLYKYGFILNDVDVIFACGIDLQKAKTILPFNVAGVQTFIEFCDLIQTCGRKMGPIVKPDMFYNISESVILTQFKQKLVEEDYYNLFAYVFMTLHSLAYINETVKYSDLFSQDLLTELTQLVQDNEEEKLVKFIKNLIIFYDHILLSAEFISYLSNISNNN